MHFWNLQRKWREGNLWIPMPRSTLNVGSMTGHSYTDPYNLQNVLAEVVPRGWPRTAWNSSDTPRPQPGLPHPCPTCLWLAAICPLPTLPAGLSLGWAARKCLFSEAAVFVRGLPSPHLLSCRPGSVWELGKPGELYLGSLRCTYFSGWGPALSSLLWVHSARSLV